MLTIRLEEPGRFTTVDTPEPADVRPGEALVRVHRVGVCGTDIHAYHGDQPFFNYPRILGHELGVQVLAVGERVSHIQPGDRCAVEPYMTCGNCQACVRGRSNCCLALKCLGVQTDGGMRERIIVPATKLHRSVKLGFDELALIEMLGIGRHAVNRAQLQAGDRVAVLGLGPIGLSVAAFARTTHASVVGLDTHPLRITNARSLLEIETLQIDPDQPLVAQWSQAYKGQPMTVFDATGSRNSMQNAFDLPAHGGALVLVGLTLGSIRFDDPAFHRKELTLKSSRNAVGAEFRQIITQIEQRELDIHAWITHRSSASEFPSRFQDWLKPGAGLLKGMIDFAEIDH